MSKSFDVARHLLGEVMWTHTTLKQVETVKEQADEVRCRLGFADVAECRIRATRVGARDPSEIKAAFTAACEAALTAYQSMQSMQSMLSAPSWGSWPEDILRVEEFVTALIQHRVQGDVELCSWCGLVLNRLPSILDRMGYDVRATARHPGGAYQIAATRRHGWLYGQGALLISVTSIESGTTSVRVEVQLEGVASLNLGHGKRTVARLLAAIATPMRGERS